MIHILNLNPSVDYFMNCDDFELNQTNHSQKESVNVGGKGSNVAMLLNNLGIDSIIHGFVGGFVGDYINSEINKFKFIQNKMIDTGLLTRINVKLNFDGETEINGQGKKIPTDYINMLNEQLNALESGDTLVMTGRVANGMSFDWYLETAKRMKDKKVDFILDINDPILKEILEYEPLLIKPNEDEIRNIFNHQGELDKDDLIKYGRAMLNKGAQHVIISLGSKGSMMFFEDKIYESNNAQGDIKNTVGAGDSMVAGFIAEYQESKDSLRAYKMGQASGNSTAFSEGIANKEMIYSIYKHIIVKEITNEN